MSKQHGLTGRKQSPEHIAARIEARRANGTYAVSDTTKAKIRVARAQQMVSHSSETRAKLSEALKGNQNGIGNKGGARTRGPANGRYKHGLRHSTTYNSWRAMLARCTYPTNNRYEYYGGRGIRVCAEWVFFDSFLADMGERPPGTSLDRIDNDGNYEPGNCRWATSKQQANNRRPRRRKD